MLWLLQKVNWTTGDRREKGNHCWHSRHEQSLVCNCKSHYCRYELKRFNLTCIKQCLRYSGSQGRVNKERSHLGCACTACCAAVRQSVTGMVISCLTCVVSCAAQTSVRNDWVTVQTPVGRQRNTLADSSRRDSLLTCICTYVSSVKAHVTLLLVPPAQARKTQSPTALPLRFN